MIPIIILVVNILFLLTFVAVLIAPGHSTEEMRAPFLKRNIAHRGFHSKDKLIPENSMAAFRAAIANGYGIEFDIQFSKDEQIVIFHDDTLKRVCGVDGRVDDYTYNELLQFSLCNSKEKIPLFTEFLALVNGQVPLVVELKNGRKNDKLCKKTYEYLKEYKGDYCIESFQPLIVAWFKRNAPHILRGQLSAGPEEFKGELKRYQAFGLSRLLTNFATRPHFISYHKRKRSWLAQLVDAMGAMKMVWTVRDSDDIAAIEKKNDTVIFEFYHPDVYFK
jgi:glycerophosphoryl diester phosphodiesterase